MSDSRLSETMIDTLRGLGPEAFAAIVAEFKRQSRAGTERVRTACLSRDVVALDSAIHSLVGALSAVGAWELAHRCHELQGRSEPIDWKDLAAVSDTLLSEIPGIQIALEREALTLIGERPALTGPRE